MCGWHKRQLTLTLTLTLPNHVAVRDGTPAAQSPSQPGARRSERTDRDRSCVTASHNFTSLVSGTNAVNVIRGFATFAQDK